VLRQSGDVILSKAPIYGEIGEIFAGTKLKPPAGSATVFKSVGIAIADLAASRVVYEAVRIREA
jgi:thiomorpholine-carboxylate dehydrogenase